MDGLRFDALTRLIGTTRSRRDTVRSAIGAGVFGLGGLALLNTTGAEAGNKGKRKRKKKKKNQPCLDAGVSCTNSAQCCPDTTKRTCEVSNQEGASERICCGGIGAVCGALDNLGNPQPPFCCKNFGCNKITLTCVSVEK